MSNLVVFWSYSFWIYLDIIIYFFCKLSFVDRNNKSIKYPGWFIILLVLFAFIPVVNWAIGIIILAISASDYYIRDGFKKWWNNLWIIKLLVKEY